jgi:phospholipid transport system transporter-binding protein
MTDAAPTLKVVGDRWKVSGAMTMDSAAQLLDASKPIAMPPAGVVDLGQVERFDSAGVSLLLAWKRRAAAEGKTLQFAHVPSSTTSLAQLYGVEEMLTS